jgi:hypothetical protein
MKRPTKEQQKALVAQWKRAAPALARARDEELRNWKYDWRAVDALLEMGVRFGRAKPASGLVEMQRLFMKAARQQGLLPAAAHEEPAVYTTRKKSKAGRRTA